MESAIECAPAATIVRGRFFPMSSKTKLLCPTCGKETALATAPADLFCSRRCQLVDLGKWLGEEYRISEPLRPDHFAEFEQLEGDGELDRPE